MIRVESTSLPVATFSKFQPQSVDFLDITNPKAVLENALRNFACLTAGDVVAIDYNEKVYELCVLETKPGAAVSIIECDMNVEFAPPVGYKEPDFYESESILSSSHRSSDEDEGPEDGTGPFRFPGEGKRLDGKMDAVPISDLIRNDLRTPVTRGIPDYKYTIGTIRFIRTPKPAPQVVSSDDGKNIFEAFGGEGKSLHHKKNTKKNV